MQLKKYLISRGGFHLPAGEWVAGTRPYIVAQECVATDPNRGGFNDLTSKERPWGAVPRLISYNTLIG